MSSTAVKSPYLLTMCSTSIALLPLFSGPSHRAPKPPLCPTNSWPLLRGSSLARRALELLGRHQHLGRHAGHVRALGIVEAHFQYDRFDVPLAPVYITLRGEVGFRGLEEDFSCSHGAAGELDLQHVAQANVVRLGFRDRRPHPGVAEIDDGH